MNAQHISEQEHIKDLVKKAWVSPEGQVVPDYVYPIVTKINTLLDKDQEKTIAQLQEGLKEDEVLKTQVLGLLKSRLVYLNDGLETISLSKLPVEEYEIFVSENLRIIPKRVSKIGSGEEAEEIKIENKIFHVLVEHTSSVFGYAPDKALNVKKIKRIDKASDVTLWSGMGAIALSPWSLLVPGMLTNWDAAASLPVMGVVAAVGGAFFMGGRSLEKKSKNEAKKYVKQMEHTEQKDLIVSYLTSSTPFLTERGTLITVSEDINDK